MRFSHPDAIALPFTRTVVSLVGFAVPLALVSLTACGEGTPADPTLTGRSSAAASSHGHVGAVGNLEPVVSFDAGSGEFPEGLASDKVGNLYVTLAPLGQVVRMTPDGSRSVLSSFEIPAGGAGALGLATDARGRVYVAVASFDPATHGVHVIAPDGTSTRLDGTDAMVFPNGLAFDPRGNLYATDSGAGQVWRISPGGSAAPWAAGEPLEGTGDFGLGVPIGANGVAYDEGVVYVLNSEKGLVLGIPVERDGAAGPVEVIAEGPDLVGVDGLALDAHGRLYAALNVQDRLVRIDPARGTVTTLVAGGEGLDFPASLTFGTGRGLRKTLFVTNFAFLDDPGSPTPPGPGIVKIGVGVPGRPLP